MSLPRLALLLLAPACAAPPHEPGASGPLVRFAPEQGTVVASADGAALYAANVDEGTIARYDRATGTVTTLAVGGEPARLAGAGDRLVVTLRADRGVVLVEDRGGALAVVARGVTGAEPVGVAAAADGQRIYVASSLEDEVWELDASLGVLRRFPVAGHPTWLALGPDDASLYVGSAYDGAVTWLDLRVDAPAGEPLAFPELGRTGDTRDQPFTRRITGDPGVSPDGTRLAIPGLWVDNVSSAGENASDPQHAIDRYAEIGLGVSPNNPGLALVELDADGRPLADTLTVLLQVGYARPDPARDPVIVRSLLASARWSADGALVYATMEGSRQLLAASADPADFVAAAEDQGFHRSPTAYVTVPEGPRGVALAGDELWVHGFQDRAIAPVATEDLSARVAAARSAPSTDGAFAGDAVELTPSSLPPDVLAGRRLFYTTVQPIMQADGVGVSCATCHFEGRNDGLTWPFEFGVRQTPSLAGPKSVTVPLTWTLEVASIADEAAHSVARLGGMGITDAELASIGAFVDASRPVDVPLAGVVSDAATRGEAIFRRADVGCAACHRGEWLTDEAAHDMYGLEGVNTPSLVGIDATPPYLHDGRAATLRDVLETARTGEMGDTSSLSEQEMEDLVAYLRTR